jgi:hypothetical protein
MLKGADIGSEGAQSALDQKNKLEQLLKGDEIKAGATAREMGLAQQLARSGRSAKVGDVSIGDVDGRSMKLQLTPAQEAAERAAGKHVEDYLVAGGRPALDKDLGALGEVEQELAKGERDNWDRVVGGATSWSPTLMGFLAPTEKGRRDKVRNTAADAARKTDANPTEKQIEAIMGQIYDPTADNKNLADRISRFSKERREKAGQLDHAAQNYQKTGYATLGGPAAPQAPAEKFVGGVKYIRVNGGWKKAQ